MQTLLHTHKNPCLFFPRLVTTVMMLLPLKRTLIKRHYVYKSEAASWKNSFSCVKCTGFENTGFPSDRPSCVAKKKRKDWMWRWYTEWEVCMQSAPAPARSAVLCSGAIFDLLDLEVHNFTLLFLNFQTLCKAAPLAFCAASV